MNNISLERVGRLDFMKISLMRKCVKGLILSLILLIGNSNSLFSQRIAMIDIKATDDEFVSNFSKAGMKLISRSEKKIVMEGVLNQEPMLMEADLTPITHVVYRVTVTHKTLFTSPKDKQKWMEAKSAFESRKSKLVNRYGAIFKEEYYFEKPYKQGKGKELKALGLGKGKWYADWGEMQYFQNLRLTMRINGEGNVLVEYWVKDAHLKFLEEEKLTQNQL